MVCHCSVPNGFPQPDTTASHPAAPPQSVELPHPAKAMTPPQRQQLGASLSGARPGGNALPTQLLSCRSPGGGHPILHS